MKRNRKSDWIPDYAKPIETPSNKQRLLVLNPFLRCLIALFFVAVFLGVTAAGFAVWQRTQIVLPARLYHQRRQSLAEYQVHYRQISSGTVTDPPAGQTYLSDLLDGIDVSFNYELSFDSTASLTLTRRLLAVVRLTDGQPGGKVFMNQITELAKPAELTLFDEPLIISESVSPDLSFLSEQAKQMVAETQAPVTAELAVVMEMAGSGHVGGHPLSIVDHLEVAWPLGQDTFSIQLRTPPDLDRDVIGSVVWEMVPNAVPFVLYPVLALLALLALILLFLFTRSRGRSRFDQELDQMRRLAGGQLVMIRDRAWDPQWCIAAADYPSLVTAARKLRQPVFCHVNRQAAEPIAYFFVQFGENNYCHIYTEDPSQLNLGFMSTRGLELPPDPGLDRDDPALPDPQYSDDQA